MRVTSNYYGQLLNALNNTEDKLQDDLQQLSTNRRVNSPSDDPTAAALEVRNLSSTADAAQYQENISSSQTFLNSANSALTSVVTSLNSAISLGVSSANGANTASQNAQNATSISNIRDQILSLANTSVQGVYVFGGTATSSAPYKLDSTATDGVSYSGNTGVNTIQVGNDLSVSGNTPGSDIFQNSSGNVFKALNDMITALNNNSQTDIESASNELQSALQTVSLKQGNYNSTLSQLNSESTYLQNETVTLQSQENNLVGADLASVISDMTQRQVTEQASMQAAAKIMPMSLLNYLQ